MGLPPDQSVLVLLQGPRGKPGASQLRVSSLLPSSPQGTLLRFSFTPPLSRMPLVIISP